MRWRIRVAFAVVPIGWLVMGDTSAFIIALIGAAALAVILVSGSWLARLEERAVRMHRAARRWR